jgi:hypothetical protein
LTGDRARAGTEHSPKAPLMKASKMTLRSALEDLVGTTLPAISGTWGKLEYISRLREAGGASYLHWGLSRVYGEVAAQEALAEAHRLLIQKVLRAPLSELQHDMMLSSKASQLNPEEYVENLRGRLAALIPQNLSGGSIRHFNSVLQALSALASHRARIRTDTTRRV